MHHTLVGLICCIYATSDNALTRGFFCGVGLAHKNRKPLCKMHFLDVPDGVGLMQKAGREMQKCHRIGNVRSIFFWHCLVWKRQLSQIVICLFLSLGITGCSSGLFSDDRLTRALQVGKVRHMSAHWFTKGQFTLLTQIAARKPGAPLRVYIEGDGFAWTTRTRPSPDPTPHMPLALYLAEQDLMTGTADNIAWVARPCQYVMLSNPKRRCAQKYWTSSRLAPEVIKVLDAAISDLKRKAHAPTVELVGYSGGGGAAVLLAAQRSDVVHVRTVAGNIDVDAFVRHHRVSPMQGSQNPLSAVSRITHIPQLHFVGAKDKIVPPAISDAFMERAGRAARRIVIPHIDHGESWITEWARLLQTLAPTL